jgi:two-component system nitrogen regulation sensor histidine kinase NtrY
VNRLRNRLILVFVAATLIPLAATLWITTSLMRMGQGLRETSLSTARSVAEQLRLSSDAYFHNACDDLKRQAQAGDAQPVRYLTSGRASWPEAVTAFAESEDADRCSAPEQKGNPLIYLVKHPDGVWQYTSALAISLPHVAEVRAKASLLDEAWAEYDLRHGPEISLVVLAAAFWLSSLALLVFLAHRISQPIQKLTAGLTQVSTGDLSVRVPPGRDDEVGRAIETFNEMAARLKESTDRMVYLRQLESLQTLARKTAHEVKNSLTPIRLTVEEMLSRYDEADRAFMEQATQIVVDEIETLERRIRAFSQFAAEPPVSPVALNVNSLLQERIALLKSAHPEVAYECRLGPVPEVMADPDLVKGILTNLLENAADAAGGGGQILGITSADREKVAIEVHDSGPGLSEQAIASLFQPTISFKKRGMGLGLSIARKSALLSGGDIVLVKGELGGAAFRVLLPIATNGYQTRPDRG